MYILFCIYIVALQLNSVFRLLALIKNIHDPSFKCLIGISIKNLSVGQITRIIANSGSIVDMLRIFRVSDISTKHAFFIGRRSFFKKRKRWLIVKKVQMSLLYFQLLITEIWIIICDRDDARGIGWKRIVVMF